MPPFEDSPIKKPDDDYTEDGECAPTGHKWPNYLPKHVQMTFTDPDSMVDIFAIAFECSIIHDKKGINVSVIEDGHAVRIIEDWPRQLSESFLACHKWLKEGSSEKTAADHPRRVAYERSLRTYKPNISSPMRSVAVIRTPFKVRSRVHKINKHIVPHDDDNVKFVKIVHIELKAVTDDYSTNYIDEAFS